MVRDQQSATMKPRRLTFGYLVTPALLVGLSVAAVLLFIEATIALVSRDTPGSMRITLLVAGAFVTTTLIMPAVCWLVLEPFHRMRYMIDLMTEGDFAVRTHVRGHGLSGQILRALDELAGIFQAQWEAARVMERRYRLLYELNPAALFRTRPDGRVLECNEAAVRLLGFDSVVDAKTRNARTFYAHPEDRDHVLAQLAREGRIRNLVVALRTKDGRELPVVLNLVATEEAGERHIDGQLVDASGLRVDDCLATRSLRPF
jgi:PAS domain S-box-containing protein